MASEPSEGCNDAGAPGASDEGTANWWALKKRGRNGGGSGGFWVSTEDSC